MLKLVATGLAVCALGLSAAADEVWKTEIGEVVYEADLDNGWAVLSYPIDEDLRGLAYFEDMAGAFTNRGAFSGVWIEPDHDGVAPCPVAIAYPDTGEASHNWGRVELIFTEPDFPGGWVALRGSCFETPENYLIGKPKTAEDYANE